MAERLGVAVRRAETADLPDLARMLARAFLDDPVAIWSSPPDRVRPRMLERLFGVRLRYLHRHNEIWTTDDLTSAAVWAPPDRWKTTVREDIAYASSLLHPQLLLRMPMVITGFLGVESNHPPKPPHWYLVILGTDPSAQGQGLGSALMSPILEECDRDGIPAYLESSKERNNAFYARHGFRVIDEMEMPRGPRVWLLWREAGSSR